MHNIIIHRMQCAVRFMPGYVVPVVLSFSLIVALVFHTPLWSNKFIPKSPIFSDEAQWIKARAVNDRAYYRRDFTFAEKPLQAWLIVAGIDNFEVYINGKSIGSEEYLGGKPSGVYDVHHLLHPGINTIAAMSGSSSRNFTTQIIIQLELRTASGDSRIVTNSSWKASNREPFKQQDKKGKEIKSLYWHDPDYYDDNWDNAVIAGNFHELVDLQPKLSGKLFSILDRTYYFWHREKTSPYLTVKRILPVKDKYIREVRMGVAVDGYYKIDINGYIIANNNAHNNQVILHNIASYISKGANKITAELYCTNLLNKAAIFGAILYADGEVQNFSSNSGWALQEEKGDEKLAFFPPRTALPQFIAGRLEQSATFNSEYYGSIVAHAALIFCAIILTGCFTVKGDAESLPLRWRLFVFPYIIAFLALLLLLAILHDPSFLITPLMLRSMLMAGVVATLFFSLACAGRTGLSKVPEI